MTRRLWHSDDYASLETERYDFYYGYEVTVGEEWAFQVKKKRGDRVEVVYTLPASWVSDDKTQHYEVADMLLLGIGKFLDSEKCE